MIHIFLQKLNICPKNNPSVDKCQHFNSLFHTLVHLSCFSSFNNQVRHVNTTALSATNSVFIVEYLLTPAVRTTSSLESTTTGCLLLNGLIWPSTVENFNEISRA